MSRSTDEVRLDEVDSRVTKRREELKKEMEPLRSEIQRLEAKWRILDRKLSDLRTLRVRLKQSREKFNTARALASQIGGELRNLDEDLADLEALDD